MRIKEIEEMFAVMPGDQFLEELVTFTAMHLDAHHNTEEDNIEAIIRSIQARLAKTDIAERLHGEACLFMLKLMHANPQLFEGTIRVLAQQNAELRAENNKLRIEVEARCREH